MPDEFPMNDPKQVWQNQPTEAIPMTLDEIRRKARRLQMIARVVALAWMGYGFGLVAGFVRTSAGGPVPIPRLGWVLMGLWCLYGVYHAFRWIWPGRLAADATWSNSLDFYRNELERQQRGYGWHLWRHSGLTWFLLGLAFLVVIPMVMGAIQNPRLLVNAIPWFVMLALWLLVFLSTKKRKRNKLQQEIDHLNSLDRGNRS